MNLVTVIKEQSQSIQENKVFGDDNIRKKVSPNKLGQV